MKVKDLEVKSVFRLVFGLVYLFVPTSIIGISRTVLSAILFMNIIQGISKIECNSFVTPVSTHQISDKKFILF